MVFIGYLPSQLTNELALINSFFVRVSSKIHLREKLFLKPDTAPSEVCKELCYRLPKDTPVNFTFRVYLNRRTPHQPALARYIPFSLSKLVRKSTQIDFSIKLQLFFQRPFTVDKQAYSDYPKIKPWSIY